jgi:hypothetical protein
MYPVYTVLFKSNSPKAKRSAVRQTLLILILKILVFSQPHREP